MNWSPFPNPSFKQKYIIKTVVFSVGERWGIFTLCLEILYIKILPLYHNLKVPRTYINTSTLIFFGSMTLEPPFTYIVTVGTLDT